MSDSDGGVGGVGGVGESSGASAASAASAAAAANSAPSAEDVANAMVDAATGPAGVNTEALGAAIAGISQANPAFGAAVQSAVESQLSAVDAGRLTGAISTAMAAQPSIAQQVATAVSLPTTPSITDVNPTYSYNPAGQLVDACGTPVTTMQAPDARAAALDKALADYDAHAQKVTGGPVSGPAYSAAYVSGMSQKDADQVHAVGKMADGFVEHWSQKAETMHVPQN